MTRIKINETFALIDELYNNNAKKINRQIKNLIEIIQTIIEIFISFVKSNVYAKSKFITKCKQIRKTLKQFVVDDNETTNRKFFENNTKKLKII